MPRLIHAPVMVCGLVSVVLGLSYEPQHRELRKRQKGAIDVVLETTDLLLDWPEGRPRPKEPLWQGSTSACSKARWKICARLSGSKNAAMGTLSRVYAFKPIRAFSSASRSWVP